ncbi:hypothetical protein TNCV_3166431 [Trichonephila clavipes]|uniref:Uncharacterized protein n=1 Tax=Trichonephila clavipes TaxID=2585209 RepID=A0A8X6V0K0_TRICX|nr:hypothetical protein TNCV_3166431 [Trichonephila clavipes]
MYAAQQKKRLSTPVLEDWVYLIGCHNFFSSCWWRWRSNTSLRFPGDSEHYKGGEKTENHPRNDDIQKI